MSYKFKYRKTWRGYEVAVLLNGTCREHYIQNIRNGIATLCTDYAFSQKYKTLVGAERAVKSIKAYRY